MDLSLKTTSIVVADDHVIYRQGLCSILNIEKEFEILAQANNGTELVSIVEKHEPNVVITDINMPFMNGIEATKNIRKLNLPLFIIALSMYNDEYIITQMIEAGANGYLTKDSDRFDIVQTIKHITTHCQHSTLRKSNELLYFNVNNRVSSNNSNSIPQLSSKEIHVTKLICQQYSSKEIAFALNVSISSIEKTRERVQNKIGAKNVAGIVTFAIKNKIYTLD